MGIVRLGLIRDFYRMFNRHDALIHCRFQISQHRKTVAPLDASSCF
ncbi:hypothetical protein LBWT_X3540 (plasmid) [Leptolyngbya boryana IAM M-101]|nr:hypothetical protein LBWT_X3540 [Leptolyngbya boryana IAM M-101]BAS66630.1 hypothetical protein LBDG_X3540 [Leptolyngbya boryana dg5]